MCRSRMWAGIALVAVLSVAVSAPASGADVGVGVRAGTQGAGAEVAVGVNKWLAVRGGFYGLNVSESVEESGIDYDGTLKLGSAGVLADFFPLGGKFRLTAGAFSNDNEVELVATPTQSQEIGGTTYTPAQIGQLLGQVSFDDTAPYAGIGWGNLARGKRFGFLFDLGVLGQGSPDVRLDSTGSGVSEGDLRSEERQLEDDLSEFDIWPVISFGLSIRL